MWPQFFRRQTFAAAVVGLLVLVNSVHADTYAAWKTRVFSESEQADPAISGELALSPAGDGIPNLLKYAFEVFDGQNCYATFLFRVGYVLHDEFEKKAFVARSRSKAVGAQGVERPAAVTGGSISANVNLRDEAAGFTGNRKFGDTRPEHSGEFTKPIQQSVPFYKSLLRDGFQIQPLP